MEFVKTNTKDLYVYRLPLSPVAQKDICLKREDVLQRIFVHFTRGSWIAMFGRRGSGRTTLLNLISQRAASLQFGGVPLIVNAAKVANSAKSGLFGAFASECRVAFERLPEQLIDRNEVLEKFLREPVSSAESPDALRRYVATIADKCHGKRLVLLLDDADLIPTELRNHVFKTLRTLHKAGTTSNIHFLLTGEDEGLWLGRFFGQGPDAPSPLREALTKYFIPMFEYDQIFDLAVQGTKEYQIAITPAAVAEIKNLTEGLPAAVQQILSFICRYAIKEELNEISEKEVRDVAWSSDYYEASLGGPPIQHLSSRLSDIKDLISSTNLGERLDRIEAALGPPEAAPDAIVALDTPGERFFLENAKQIQRDYAGEWIAVIGSRIASHDSGFQKMMESFKQGAVDEAPYVLFVPGNDEGVQ